MIIQRGLVEWSDVKDNIMENHLIQLLLLLLSISYVCKGQNARISCIERAEIKSQSCYIQSTTDDLLSTMPNPKKVTRNRIENFLVIDSSNSCIKYSQEINILWFKDIGYRDVQGMASLYWISFKNNRLSIIIEDQMISRFFTLDDFQNKYVYTRENVYYQDKNNNLVCQDSPKWHHTCICMPICNTMGSEHIVFCFSKKGLIEHIRIYTMSPLIPAE